MICVIPQEILSKYHICPASFEENPVGVYHTFLIQTDYVPAKLAEAAFLGKSPDEDYTEVLNYRQSARDAINEISSNG